MSNSDLMTMFFSMLLGQLPILIVCVVAVIVILSKKKLLFTAVFWSLLGFGLVLFLSVAMPLVNTAVQHWVLQSDNVGQRAWVFSIVGIISAVLQTAAYAFLLVAIIAGRSGQSAPPPLNA